ncbi:MAG: energy-coupling factor transporter transmembrane protein EcfT [Oscillospiraceae bacterium]|jgi:energy-coupling factor transport system permease protein|nr:energy-coupling factor transporter transmembrane protein EcfT [Oscillospiraceae bacterium]
MTGLLDYVQGESFLHRLNPLTKLVLSFALCAAVFITDSHLIIIGILAAVLAFSAAAGTVSRSLRILSSLGKLSILLFIVQILFVRDGKVLLHLPFGLVITDSGVLFSLLFVLRFMTATLPLALMLAVTRISDLANVLVKSLHMPYSYAFALTTAIRFIPLFAEEMSGIMETQTARGVEFDTKNFFKKVRLLLPLCVPLLISSVRKTEGGAISAELRGFNLRKRNCGFREYPLRVADVLAVLFGVAVILTVSVF